MKHLKFFPFFVLSIVPFWLLYLLSDVIFIFVYRIFKYRRVVVRGNLERSFPDKTIPEIIEIEKKFYHHFCDLAFESIKILSMSNPSITKRFKITNQDFIEELYDQKKSIIMYTSHYGNWEWLSFLPLLIPYHVQTFYQKLSNNYFDQFMLMLRSNHGADGIESKQGYKSMVKLKQDKKMALTCIIGDQSPKKHSSKHWVNFLNQDTAFLVGADRIAEKLNQTVIFVSFTKPSRGKYEITFIPMQRNEDKEKGETLIDQYAKLLEKNIHKTPELWLWSHRRWKRKRSENEQK